MHSDKSSDSKDED